MKLLHIYTIYSPLAYSSDILDILQLECEKIRNLLGNHKI